MANKSDYDVIIIGAGIGGLVCGCYLAKAGLRTLIVEQHLAPGGYCTSFFRKGYRFDTSVHYVGGVKNGVLAQILKQLVDKGEIKFYQADPADKVIVSGKVTYIRANPADTIKEFKKSFPSEKTNVENFFKYMLDTSILDIYRQTGNLSFKQFLDSYFKDDCLKATISLLLLSNMGVPPSRISTPVSIIFIREFLLDPGYYPEGGMQQFANFLANKFKQFGGDLLLSNKVSRIPLNNNGVASGVVIDSIGEVRSKYVVSAVDATQTFNELIDKKTKELSMVNKLLPSTSIFAVYLGLKEGFRKIIGETCNIWMCNELDIDKMHNDLSRNLRSHVIKMGMFSFPSAKDKGLKISGDIMEIFTPATYEGVAFWNKHRIAIKESLLSLAESCIPGLKGYVDIVVDATPVTFQRYTSNRDGACYGWASTIEQVDGSLLPQVTSIKNLFLVGHWCMMGGGQGGVSTVALSGKKVSERILVMDKKV